MIDAIVARFDLVSFELGVLAGLLFATIVGAVGASWAAERRRRARAAAKRRELMLGVARREGLKQW